MLPTGTLIASVDPETSKSYAGELVIIPTWSSEPSMNKACVSPFDSNLASTEAEPSLKVKLPPLMSTAVDIATAPVESVSTIAAVPSLALIFVVCVFTAVVVVNVPAAAVVPPITVLSMVPELASIFEIKTLPVPAGVIVMSSFDLDPAISLSSIVMP